MKTEFKRSFVKDLGKVHNDALKRRVKETIELVEQAASLNELENLKKLKAGDRYYRIRVGDYRIGIAVDGDLVTFIRFLHRKDIYRYFP